MVPDPVHRAKSVNKLPKTIPKNTFHGWGYMIQLVCMSIGISQKET